ncbi:DDB1- and CUL4-associated factor 5-like [Myxocyprinus asiaticus]|uniref:DDB1- and CUL4-associated factor 5-like n=1 Tax=Myxocyprinus asiaticus TaxID=70543 RepID=UPI002222EBC6|nr:DDB1- and CUL4-associated factor 5-like [Myxocyprinus asiaticus]
MKEVRGCGMRSAVGFLSRRTLGGQPHLKEEFQRRRLAGCSTLFKKDMLGHFGCVNAIEFSNNGGQWLVSGGDDRRVLLWHMEKAIHSRAKPIKLKGEHLSNIFCLAFDSTNKRVFSGGNDEQVILHDVERGETLNVFLHDDAVYGLSVSPVNDNVFASSSDDGRVLIWDTREPPHGEPFCLANYPSAFHSVMFNPVEPRLLATANSKEGVGLWDIRKPRSSLLRYGGSLSLQSAMSVRFNSTGTQLLALRRRLPPVLYELHSRLPSFQFDNQGYFNSCTMKSCCFAGDRDQYILSGSDDFNLYMWRIPNDPEAGGVGRVVNGAFMVLKGHRSIVNQVRFNPHTYMICSSGVEKVIKVWSPYQQPDSVGDLEGLVEDKSRSLYTHEEYISLVLNSGSGLSHDYVSQSVQEDPRMMAFFDSLVRREIEGWSSDSDSDLSEGAILQLHARARRATRSTARSPANASATHHSDSDHSSSSSLAGPNASGSERTDLDRGGSQRSQAEPRASAFLLDLVNEDSDSSGFWLDPMPRPRSPSPRENSSLSSHASSEGVASSSSSSPSSSSSSSSSSDGVDEELRRSRMRQRNAARWRRHIGLSGRDSALNPHTATDASNYPSISVHDLSSLSSTSGDEGRPIRNSGKEKTSGHISSPTRLSDRLAQSQSRFRRRIISSHSGDDAPVERAKSRVGLCAESTEELERGRTSGEDLNVTHSAQEEVIETLSSHTTVGSGVNGRPHTDVESESPADSIHAECSMADTDLSKNSGEPSGWEAASVAGKRTCSDSGDEGYSPLEKKAKIL